MRTERSPSSGDVSWWGALDVPSITDGSVAAPGELPAGRAGLLMRRTTTCVSAWALLLLLVLALPRLTWRSGPSEVSRSPVFTGDRGGPGANACCGCRPPRIRALAAAQTGSPGTPIGTSRGTAGTCSITGELLPRPSGPKRRPEESLGGEHTLLRLSLPLGEAAREFSDSTFMTKERPRTGERDRAAGRCSRTGERCLAVAGHPGDAAVVCGTFGHDFTLTCTRLWSAPELCSLEPVDVMRGRCDADCIR